MPPQGSKRSVSRPLPLQPVPRSSLRRWLFRLAAAILVPSLLLLIAEASLRLAGVGYSTSFFLPMKIRGADTWVENDRFGWRFFGPEMARAPFPFSIPKTKAPNTIRIFVFGESAAYGDPQPEFGLSRMLQALLEGRYPSRHFEVVNTAMTAINSHVILPIARDCASRNGDFWVIYAGNNEVVGPFGAGTVFGAQAPNLSLVRAEVALKATRLGQAFGSLLRHFQKRPLNQSEWGGMAMFLQGHVRAEDPKMATVYNSFERNLSDIVEIGRRSGARVVVSTICRNLKDCGPFASDHRPGLTGEQLAHWNELFQNGVRAQEQGRLPEALDCFGAAQTYDDTFAECSFRSGQCALALGNEAQAARQFSAACDQDVLRFRADGRINEIIRRVASRGNRAGVRLVDSEAVLTRQSPHGAIGQEFLYEHVHLTFDGNYQVARAIAEVLGQELGDSAKPWPAEDDCALRLGWNDYFRRAADKEILSRLNDSPFKEQADHRQQYLRLLNEVQQLQPATALPALEQDKARLEAAVKAAPEDWILRENYAQLQSQTGEATGAADSLRRVSELLPFNPEVWQTLGQALEAARRDDDAIGAFEEANRLRPDSMASLNSLAELYARQNRLDEAEQTFRAILRRKPYWGPAHVGLGKLLERNGQAQAAQEEFKEAFKNRIRSPESYCALAQLAFSHGWYETAVTNFTDALRLDPSDAQSHVNLGLALAKLGKHAEAKAHYVEAVRLQPSFAEAHFCLGLEQGKEGDAANASAEFMQAVRLKPDLLEARLNLGIALANQHLNQEALEQFDEVLRRDPANHIAATYSKLLHGH